jgi:hypothetical protein
LELVREAFGPVEGALFPHLSVASDLALGGRWFRLTVNPVLDEQRFGDWQCVLVRGYCTLHKEAAGLN